MKIEPFALVAEKHLLNGCTIALLSMALTQMVPRVAADDLPPLEHYRLEVVAFSLDYPPNNPRANTRQFGQAAQINEGGEVLFAAYWRDDTWQYNTLNMSRSGTVRQIVSSEDPVPDYPGLKFAGGLGSRQSNFDDYAFNKRGELLFSGGVIAPNPRPSPPPEPPSGWAFSKASPEVWSFLQGRQRLTRQTRLLRTFRTHHIPEMESWFFHREPISRSGLPIMERATSSEASMLSN